MVSSALSPLHIISKSALNGQNHICELPEAESHVLIAIESANDQASIAGVAGDAQSLKALDKLIGAQSGRRILSERCKSAFQSEVMSLAEGNFPFLDSPLNCDDLLEAILVEPVEACLRIGALRLVLRCSHMQGLL